MNDSAAPSTVDSIPAPGSPVRSRGRGLGFVAGVAFVSVLSAGVGAGAATLVTSADIKDGTIVEADVKDGGLTGTDLRNGSVTGNDLKDGSVGAKELAPAAQSVIDDRIPSGRTVTGMGYFDTTAGGGDFGFTISLPGRAHAVLATEMVNFGSNGDPANLAVDEDPQCTGKPDAPTAPPGKVCLYLVSSASGTADVRGTQMLSLKSDRDFGVRWDDTGGDVYVHVVWAYTAP